MWKCNTKQTKPFKIYTKDCRGTLVCLSFELNSFPRQVCQHIPVASAT